MTFSATRARAILKMPLPVLRHRGTATQAKEWLRLIMSKCIVTTIALLMAAHGGKAQTSPTAAAPALPARVQTPSPVVAAPSSSPKAWRIGPLDVSGMIDGYYSLGFNHPADHMLMGIVVDGLGEVLNLASADIEDTPDFGDGTATPYLFGMAKVKGKAKIRLEIERVLTSQDLHGLNDLIQEVKS